MQYFCPETLNDLLLLLDYEENSRIIAGGTDLVIALEQMPDEYSVLIDLTGIEAISGINMTETGLVIGAATRIADIASNSSIPDCLREGAAAIGSPQIRNMATIGGNICNASPCGDTLAPLICLNADFLLQSSKGSRIIPAEQFFLGPKKTVLGKKEILSEIRIGKKYLNGYSGFKMIGQRNGQVISQVNLAIWLYRKENSNEIEDIRIGAGSVAPTPVRIIEAEQLLCHTVPNGSILIEAGRLVQQGISPISDVRSTAIYRKDVITALFQDIIYRILEV